eukprot:10569626-Karenia_brevis.AAC.1
MISGALPAHQLQGHRRPPQVVLPKAGLTIGLTNWLNFDKKKVIFLKHSASCKTSFLCANNNSKTLKLLYLLGALIVLSHNSNCLLSWVK